MHSRYSTVRLNKRFKGNKKAQSAISIDRFSCPIGDYVTNKKGHVIKQLYLKLDTPGLLPCRPSYIFLISTVFFFFINLSTVNMEFEKYLTLGESLGLNGKELIDFAREREEVQHEKD